MHIPALYEPERNSGTFGAARFLTVPEAIQLQLHDRCQKGRERPLVGWLSDGQGNTPLPVFSFDAEGHLITFAPTRAGKGTSQIVLNLLILLCSLLVLDVKGENYKLTAGYRRKVLGQKVVRFSPFEAHTDVWNPFVCFRVDRGNPEGTAEEQEDISYFSSLVVEVNPKADEPFFDNSACKFSGGLITYVATVPTLNAATTDSDPVTESLVRERSMFEVTRLLNLSGKAFKALLLNMAKSQRPLVQQAANGMLDLLSGDGRTGKSVLAIAREKLNVWAQHRVRRATYRASGDPKDLEPAPNTVNFKDLRDPNGATIYLCIPPEAIGDYRPVLRAMVGWAMRELRMNAAAEEKKRSVLFLLDEFPQLGYMQPIEAALLYLVGYGVRFWFFVQDRSQLQLHYPNSWQTFLANSATHCFFGVNDMETARLISERIGTTTVENVVHSLNTQRGEGRQESEAKQWSATDSDSEGGGPGGSTWNSGTSRTIGETHTTGKNWNYSEGAGIQFSQVGRELLKPEEVLTLPYEQQVIFMRPLPPVLCHKIDYYLIDELKKSAAIPPPHPVNFD